jgi:Ser/Thr protein kinase RdoA (MazF antagonist)
MSPLRPAHATVSTGAASEFAGDRFPIGRVERCRLIRHGFNDTYLVDAAAGRFVLRLTRTGRRRASELAEEAAYVDHLMQHGVPVAAPIRGRDGRFEQIAEAADGERGALLFTYATGCPFRASPADAAATGETLARVHMVSESFAGAGARPALDLDRLLDRPLTSLLSLIDDRPDAHAVIMPVADRLRACITERAPQLTRGYCHGDCHGGNAHFGADGMATFFDFDDGGPGWIAYDLSVFLWGAYLSGSSERRALWRHFLRGYMRRRRVASADLDAVPLFIALRHLWLLGEYAAGAEVWGTVWLGEWFDRQLVFLKHWQDEQLADPLGLVEMAGRVPLT